MNTSHLIQSTREDIVTRNVAAPNYAEMRPRPWHTRIHLKRLALGAGLLVCLGVFTGCSPTSADTPEKSPTQSTQTTASATSTPKQPVPKPSEPVKAPTAKPVARKPKLRSFGKDTKGQFTYEYYAADSAEEARLYLSSCHVSEPNYYIQVETPEGVWGLDKEGLYLVELLPFQKNLSLAECEGKLTSVSLFNTTMAAQAIMAGVVDNFVSKIACGNCGHEWHDGVRYKNKTVVKCPACKKYNSVDTSNITAEVIN